MPSDFPRSPKFLKGALVSFPSHFLGPVPNVIVFQYNPEKLSRSLAHRSSPSEAGEERGGAVEDVHRVEGAPVETIDVTIELDAADQLAEVGRHPHVLAHGLHPALAALELLLYPSSSQKLKLDILRRGGSVQVTSYDLPLTLFVWGKSRVVPVHLTNFSITEQAFDQQLNPIRAEVQLGMRVLTDMELQESSLGRGAYTVYQTQKEVLARLNLLSSAEQITGLLPF
jgi:hypothetical protein